MLAICSGWSFRPGGIFSSLDCSTARTSRLSSGLPGLIAGPRLPPVRMASPLVSASPLDLVVSLWHGWQLVLRIRWISAPSDTGACCATNAGTETNTEAARNIHRQKRSWQFIATHYTLSNPDRSETVGTTICATEPRLTAAVITAHNGAAAVYRNYDGAKSAFGNTSGSTTVPNPDNVSAFAAVRSERWRFDCHGGQQVPRRRYARHDKSQPIPSRTYSARLATDGIEHDSAPGGCSDLEWRQYGPIAAAKYHTVRDSSRRRAVMRSQCGWSRERCRRPNDYKSGARNYPLHQRRPAAEWAVQCDRRPTRS